MILTYSRICITFVSRNSNQSLFHWNETFKQNFSYLVNTSIDFISIDCDGVNFTDWTPQNWLICTYAQTHIGNNIMTRVPFLSISFALSRKHLLTFRSRNYFYTCQLTSKPTLHCSFYTSKRCMKALWLKVSVI
jgi:hypothetical protein